MNLRWAALLALALTPAALFAAEGTFDKTLTVNGAVNLKISTGSGYIHITPGNDNSVHIVGHVHSGMNWLGHASDDRVREITANPPIEQNGNTIEVGQHTHYENVSIDYVVSVPHGTVIEADSGSGDLNITNISGPLKAETGSGTIFANSLTGDVTLHTGSGDIHAEMSNPHYVKAETGSGSIKLEGLSGSLYAETGSGDIEAAGQPGSDWKLETGSGSVTLNIGNAHFTLDAETGSGDIHSDPSISTHGQLERNHLRGDVNGGGPTVRVETGSGDIRIH